MERMMTGFEVLTPGEAAAELGISAGRVREMIRSGKLPARRTGNGWIIPASAVAALRGNLAPSGRPPSPVTAWAVITLLGAALSGESTPRDVVPDRRMRYSALRLIAALPDPEADIAPWRRILASRGQSRRMRMHPGVIARLEADPRVSPGGSDAVSPGDGLTRCQPVLYVREQDAAPLISRYRMRDDSGGQVTLVIVPAAVPDALAPHPGKPVTAPAAAADLLGENSSRARRGGITVLRDCRAAIADRRWIPGGVS
jgi:excisionase family DNA binding protein